MDHSAADIVAYGATVLLGFVVVPVWLFAGLADYFCHRATNIENNSGVPESAMHVIQFGLVGLPLTAALFFQVDAGLLTLMVAFIVLHHIVAFVDVRYANGHRTVYPIEQMVHSFLELLPIAAFLLLCALEFGQVQAISGAGAEHADFTLHLLRQPLPLWYVASVLVAAALLGVLPYTEEFVRCVRASRRNMHPTQAERYGG